MKAKKAIAKLHLWLGLSSGLVVFIVAVTGKRCVCRFFQIGSGWTFLPVAATRDRATCSSFFYACLFVYGYIRINTLVAKEEEKP